jgi:hypothetical protein
MHSLLPFFSSLSLSLSPLSCEAIVGSNLFFSFLFNKEQNRTRMLLKHKKVEFQVRWVSSQVWGEMVNEYIPSRRRT